MGDTQRLSVDVGPFESVERRVGMRPEAHERRFDNVIQRVGAWRDLPLFYLGQPAKT